jgi:hypothetical protein
MLSDLAGLPRPRGTGTGPPGLLLYKRRRPGIRRREHLEGHAHRGDGPRPAKTQDHVRTHHDEWVKRALSLWLGALGDVQIDARIAGESRRGDVLYTERRKRPAHRLRLGALGELACGIVLFEVFRNPVIPDGISSCVLKAVDLAAQQKRAARRDGKRRSCRRPPSRAKMSGS